VRRPATSNRAEPGRADLGLTILRGRVGRPAKSAFAGDNDPAVRSKQKGVEEAMPSDSTDRYAGNAVAPAILSKRSAGLCSSVARNTRCDALLGRMRPASFLLNRANELCSAMGHTNLWRKP
jgi:hypothetical protein